MDPMDLFVFFAFLIFSFQEVVMPLKMIVDAAKQAAELVGQALAWSQKRKGKEDRQRFEHGKQQFLMEWVTLARQHRGNGFKPTPGTVQFEYCETLTRDGDLDRDVLTGYYILKGPGHMAAYGAPYNPALY